MKTIIAITALTASAAFTWAQDVPNTPETTPATPATPTASAAQPANKASESTAAAASAVTAEQAIAMTENLFSTMKELTAILKQVKDKSTADAAAPKVKELVARMEAVQSESKGMGEPSQEVLEAVEAHFQGKEEEATRLMQEFIGVMFPLMLGDGKTPFFGSEAMQSAMAPLTEQQF